MSSVEEKESGIAEENNAGNKKRRRLHVIALVIAGILFVSANAGLVFGTASGILDPALSEMGLLKNTGDRNENSKNQPFFREMEKLVIDLGPAADADFVRAQFAIEGYSEESVEFKVLEPRIKDALNVFIRSLDERDLERRRSVHTIRDEAARRIRNVLPEDVVVTRVLVTDLVLR